MGYRSQVCIGMTDEASRLFRTILEHIPENHEVHSLLKDAETSNHPQPWTDHHRKSDTDCGQNMYWDYVKWYDSYECVSFIEDFITNCISEEDYRFVRVGEESCDTDERGEFYDAEIYVSRSISW